MLFMTFQQSRIYSAKHLGTKCVFGQPDSAGQSTLLQCVCLRDKERVYAITWGLGPYSAISFWKRQHIFFLFAGNSSEWKLDGLPFENDIKT